MRDRSYILFVCGTRSKCTGASVTTVNHEDAICAQKLQQIGIFMLSKVNFHNNNMSIKVCNQQWQNFAKVVHKLESWKMCILFKANITVEIFESYVTYSRAYFYLHSVRKMSIIANADQEDRAFTDFMHIFVLFQAKVYHHVAAFREQFQCKLAFFPQNISTKDSRKKTGQWFIRNTSSSFFSTFSNLYKV